MPRLIDADALLKSFDVAWMWEYDETGCGVRKKAVPTKTIDEAPTIDAEPVITGDTSDGYHTFNELYHHRAVLFSVIVKAFSEKAWKSRKHHDGTMYDDMFIVGIETPEGQATYHYNIDPYWKMFQCKEVEFAPEWDGHTPEQAIERIRKLEPVRHGRVVWKNRFMGEFVPDITITDRAGEKHTGTLDTTHYEPVPYCSECCKELGVSSLAYCPNCGAKMDGGADNA